MKIKKRAAMALLVAAALVMTACGAGEEQKPPDSSGSPAVASELEPSPTPESSQAWRTDAPVRHQMDPAILNQLHAALAESSVYAMVTVKDGVVVDEYYQEGFDETSLFPLHSCSKSFTGALIGIAIEQGLIGGVDDPLSDYLPQVLTLPDPDKRQITLRHLLTHTSGLEWYEWGGSHSNWSEFQSAENWVEYILNRELVSQPGSAFAYSTGNTHLLTAALEQAVGMSALEYGRRFLFEPLGMDSVAWSTDPQGVTDGGNGISMTARDAARFGQLYLEGGAWNGRQLIPASWIEISTSPQNNGAGDGTGSYGYQWWIRPFGAQNHDVYYAFGAWGQYLFVVPDLNLVTVLVSHYPQNSYAPRPYFTDYLLAACNGAGQSQ